MSFTQPVPDVTGVVLVSRATYIRRDSANPRPTRELNGKRNASGWYNVFFCKQCRAVNAGGILRLLKSQCDGTGESRTRTKLDAEGASYGRCCAFPPWTLQDVLTHHASSISLVIKLLFPVNEVAVPGVQGVTTKHVSYGLL